MGKHLHYVTESRDCDGTYDRSWTVEPEPSIEADDDKFGDWVVTQFAMALPQSLDFLGDSNYLTVAYTPGTLEFTQPTEEGYRHVSISLCGCDRTESTFRDRTAEAAGY